MSIGVVLSGGSGITISVGNTGRGKVRGPRSAPPPKGYSSSVWAT